MDFAESGHFFEYGVVRIFPGKRTRVRHGLDFRQDRPMLGRHEPPHVQQMIHKHARLMRHFHEGNESRDHTALGTGFPAITYRLNTATVGATFDVSDRISVRVFDKYETGHISDWHYAGFNQSLVVGNTLYSDGGPQSYNENLLGVFVSVKL